MDNKTKPKPNIVDDEIKTMTLPIRVKERPRRDRANAAINIIKKQISKNLGSVVEISKIVVGESINKAVFARGRERPPHSLKISAKKTKGIYYTELEGVEIKQKIIEKKTSGGKKPHEKGFAGMLEQMKKKAGIEEKKSEESEKTKQEVTPAAETKVETLRELKEKESEKVDKEIMKK